MEFECLNNSSEPGDASHFDDKSTRCLNCNKSMSESILSDELECTSNHTHRRMEKSDLYKPRSKSKDKSRNFSSVSKNMNSSDLEDFIDYADGLSVVIPERKKRRRCKEVMLNNDKEIDDEIEDEIEDQLKEKAEKTNLTVANVKSMIKHIIENESIRNYIRKSMKDDSRDNNSLDFCYEPKLTRSKTKQLLQSNSEIIWPITPITPIKKPKESEHLVLINEELPDESDDEEYKPPADALQDQSEDESGRQSVVSNISYSSIMDQSYIECFDSNLLNSAPDPIFKIPEENIGQRTRSKLCLSDTPLEAIETAYIPPDITNDMYDFECDNEDWENFLKDFMQPLPNDAEDEDEADPEYNVMADEEVVDKEEFRMDRASKVSKREETDLYRELVIPVPDELTSEEEDENCPKQDTTIDQVQLTLEDRTEPVLKEEVLEEPSENINIEPSPEQMTAKQIAILEQQQRQLVQIVTQNFLQTCGHPLYCDKYSGQCKQILGTLVELAKFNEKSYHNAYNLKSAFELVEKWERYLLSEEGEEVMEHMRNEVAAAKKAEKVNNCYRVQFHPSLLELMSKSDVFLYPLLLPTEAFRCSIYHKVEFVFSEDHLIAIGLEEFTQFLNKNPRWFDKKKVTEKSIVELICKYLLPTKKTGAVIRHIRNVKSVEGNPIAYYEKNKKAPPTIHYVIPFNQFLIKPLCQQDRKLLPKLFCDYIYPPGKDEDKENGVLIVNINIRKKVS